MTNLPPATVRASDVAGAAGDEVRALGRSRPAQWLVRGGFVARGITYGIIGLLTLALALGAGTLHTAPDQQGALALIARAPLGKVALVVIAAGLFAYALWKLWQGIFGRGPEGGGGPALKDRVANLSGGVVYLVFCAVAVRTLVTGNRGSGSGDPKHAARGVLGWPGGPVLVAVAGGILIAISAYQAYDAVRGNFAGDSKTEQLDESPRTAFMALGRVGLLSRALVFALVGYFLLRTAITFRARDAVGLNGALERLGHTPLGPWLVGLAAVGLLVFAVFSLAEARYRRL